MNKQYSKILLAHYRKPKHTGSLNNPDRAAHYDNPACGDEIDVYLKVSRGKLHTVKYKARGCALSLAAASALSDLILNQGLNYEKINALGVSDVESTLGVKISKARHNCATLFLQALKIATAKNHDFIN